MDNFIYPSDQSRADNDELNEVCEYAEHLEETIERFQNKLTECDAATRKTFISGPLIVKTLQEVLA